MKPSMRILTFMAIVAVALSFLFHLSARGNDVSRIPFAFTDSFDFPAGSVCDFNYHGEISAEGFMIEQRDASGLVRVISHQVTLEFVNTNLDTGKILIGTGHQNSILDGFVEDQPGHIRIAGINWQLRDVVTGRLELNRAGLISIDIATDSGKTTPNVGPHFDEEICPALGGHFRLCGDSFCGFEENSENCPADCGTCNSNGICEPALGESHISCAADCMNLCHVGEVLCHDGASCGRVCDGAVQCSEGLFIDPSFDDENICGNCGPGTFGCPSNPDICITPCEGQSLSNVEIGGGSQFSCDFGNFPTEESTLFCGGCGDGVCQSGENSTNCPSDCP